MVACGERFLLLAYLLRRIKADLRSEEHTSELQSQSNLVCRLLLEKKKKDRHGTQQFACRGTRCRLPEPPARERSRRIPPRTPTNRVPVTGDVGGGHYLARARLVA